MARMVESDVFHTIIGHWCLIRDSSEPWYFHQYYQGQGYKARDLQGAERSFTEDELQEQAPVRLLTCDKERLVFLRDCHVALQEIIAKAQRVAVKHAEERASGTFHGQAFHDGLHQDATEVLKRQQRFVQKIANALHNATSESGS